MAVPEFSVRPWGHPRLFSLCVVAAVALCALGGAAPAFSQSADDAAARLSRIEREIDTLNRAVYKGETAKEGMPAPLSPSSPSSYQADLEVRISGIEKQIQDLTGRLEQQNFDISQMREKLDRALADIELRLGDVDKKAGLASPSSSSSSPLTGGEEPPPGIQSGTLAPGDKGGVVPQPPSDFPPLSAPADPNAPAPADSPTQQPLGSLREAPGGAGIPPKDIAADPASLYEGAFSQLKNGNYVKAQGELEGFLKSFPDHPLAANATYWLGECHYAQGHHDKAARIFAESYKKYPKGPKVADSLLKMGMSLGGLGKTKEACVTLQQLKKEFPSGQATVLRRADQEMTRLGCAR